MNRCAAAAVPAAAASTSVPAASSLTFDEATAVSPRPERRGRRERRRRRGPLAAGPRRGAGLGRDVAQERSERLRRTTSASSAVSATAESVTPRRASRSPSILRPRKRRTLSVGGLMPSSRAISGWPMPPK